MPRRRFVRSGDIQPAINGLTACQIVARRRARLVEARRGRVAALRPRLKRHQQAADCHRRGGEPEDSATHESRIVRHVGLSLEHLKQLIACSGVTIACESFAVADAVPGPGSVACNELTEIKVWSYTRPRRASART